ncbi:alpha/beta hydrolase [uncultured Paraglaciecola sp.]|mgnify:FL=1|jgi:abhydrolase domain-containing protein 6|uniref:alpha/beta fold hydrolase n=1 Tax=uncultured Paraglaciecola sp. TaxID=1765024 RepID=UPI0025FC569D|nr:alpha/beta hydrolase [uncultured Paraglaciecola sp.]
MKFVLIMALIIGLIMMLSTRQRRMSLTKSLFSMINRIEAKLAGLGCHSTVINELEVFYLSNTQHFNDDKPVLVLLHGFSRDSYVWNRFAKRFSAHYHLLIPDIKGHGQTAYHPSHDYSVPSQCKMLLVLLDKLQISRFSIIGNSMGGLMAAKLIIDIPDRIEKSVLIDPAGAKSEFAHYMIDNQINPFSHKVEQDFFDFYDLIMAKPPYVPKFILRALARQYIDKREQYTHMFKQFFRCLDFYPNDFRFDYANAMLIWGLNDKLLPVADYTQWKTMLNSKTHIYEDLGHMPMVEDVKRVSADILRFLKA